MTIAEKTEQSISHRPNSYVPGKTLARLLKFDFHSSPEKYNWSMHWGQGILAAGIRGAMSYYGIVGPFGSYLFMGVRLLIDQTLENWTGVGSLPWTWPVGEQIVDLAHKAIFAATTGYVADRLIFGESLNA
ncbi:hypothetical protein LTR84_000273 [Exophiala bonariae]|uniref:DUF1440 domain-containing protein n=1 Tax=Exophiala bonariae TaxID=1690606 RepID=A0AAV9NU36_9EURO|nr:hypothetical protein LTR84_000273 [Exophiala bonariae]